MSYIATNYITIGKERKVGIYIALYSLFKALYNTLWGFLPDNLFRRNQWYRKTVTTAVLEKDEHLLWPILYCHRSCHDNAMTPLRNSLTTVFLKFSTQSMRQKFESATFVDVAWCCSRACALVRVSTCNMPQHVATWWPYARNMLRPTMLRYVR